MSSPTVSPQKCSDYLFRRSTGKTFDTKEAKDVLEKVKQHIELLESRIDFTEKEEIAGKTSGLGISEDLAVEIEDLLNGLWLKYHDEMDSRKEDDPSPEYMDSMRAIAMAAYKKDKTRNVGPRMSEAWVTTSAVQALVTYSYFVQSYRDMVRDIEEHGNLCDYSRRRIAAAEEDMSSVETQVRKRFRHIIDRDRFQRNSKGW